MCNVSKGGKCVLVQTTTGNYFGQLLTNYELLNVLIN